MTTELQGFVAKVRYALYCLENNVMTTREVRELRQAFNAFTAPGGYGHDGGGDSAAPAEDDGGGVTGPTTRASP